MGTGAHLCAHRESLKRTADRRKQAVSKWGGRASSDAPKKIENGAKLNTICTLACGMIWI